MTKSILCNKCLQVFSRHIHRTITSHQFFSLLEIGKLETPQVSGYYPAGQFFLHRVFGYRGVILFPWTTCVYDRDTDSHNSSRNTWEEDGLLYDHIKGLRPESQSYYQALIDNKDFPYIVSICVCMYVVSSSLLSSAHTQRPSLSWLPVTTALCTPYQD